MGVNYAGIHLLVIKDLVATMGLLNSEHLHAQPILVSVWRHYVSAAGLLPLGRADP